MSCSSIRTSASSARSGSRCLAEGGERRRRRRRPRTGRAARPAPGPRAAARPGRGRRSPAGPAGRRGCDCRGPGRAHVRHRSPLGPAPITAPARLPGSGDVRGDRVAAKAQARGCGRRAASCASPAAHRGAQRRRGAARLRRRVPWPPRIQAAKSCGGDLGVVLHAPRPLPEPERLVRVPRSRWRAGRRPAAARSRRPGATAATPTGEPAVGVHRRPSSASSAAAGSSSTSTSRPPARRLPRSTRPPVASASSWAPRQIPSVGTPRLDGLGEQRRVRGQPRRDVVVHRRPSPRRGRRAPSCPAGRRAAASPRSGRRSSTQRRRGARAGSSRPESGVVLVHDDEHPGTGRGVRRWRRRGQRRHRSSVFVRSGRSQQREVAVQLERGDLVAVLLPLRRACCAGRSRRRPRRGSRRRARTPP